MVDSPKDTHEDFVISQDDDVEEAQDLGQEEYYENQSSMWQSKSNLTYIIGGVGLVLIVVLLIFALAGPSDNVDRKQLQALEERIQALEKRLATIGVLEQALARIDNNEKELGLIMARVDRFEGTVNTQIDQIIKELGKLYQKADAEPAANVKSAQPAAKSSPEKQVKIHEVRAGDTLYSISRRYGLTVDQLRTYNNIGQDAAIRPGQKLKLSPP